MDVRRRPWGGLRPAANAESEPAVGLYHTVPMVRERWKQFENSCLVTSVLGFVGALALQVSRTWSPTHWATTAALLLLGVVPLLALREARRGADLVKLVGLVATVGIVVNLTALAHVGPLSIVAVPLPVIVFALGSMDLRREALLGYLVASFGLLGVAVLAYVGAVPLTNRVLALKEGAPSTVLRGAAFVEFVLLVALVMARSFRNAKVRAMAELDAALLEVRRRRALVREAEADLDEACEAGRVGRFTGHDVGPFVAGEVIGRGSSGEVYAARRRDDAEAVAVKIFYRRQREPGAGEDPLQAYPDCALVESPHIVRVRKRGVTSDGLPFIAMELAAGRDLSVRLRERPLDLNAAATLVRHVCAALCAAHAARIVHRDLKPQNIVDAGTATAPMWKVLDFSAPAAPGSAGVGGTPAYASPEQARGDLVDARSDVCSLGLVAYRAVTGHPPFAGSRAAAVLYNAIHAMPLPPSASGVPADVELALAVAIAKDPADRYQTAEEFGAAFDRAVRGELPPALRARARRVLERSPWGSLRSRTESSE